MYKIAIIFISCFLSVIPYSNAAEKTIMEDHTHSMSDNESKNDARRLCYFLAKQKLFKKAFVYLEENKVTQGAPFSKKDIETCLPVLLQVETENEKWEFADAKISVSIAVRTTVNSDYLKKRIQTLNNDKELQRKIKKDQARLNTLEQEYIALQKQLVAANNDTSMPLRKERQAISSEIDRIEKVKYLIASKTKLVADKIMTGMTIDEIITIAGQPRSTATCEKPDFLNYGNIWVWINNGIVIGKIPIEKWSGPCYRYSTIDRKNQQLENKKSMAHANEPEKPKFEIILKTGQSILTSIYYTVNDVVYYKKYGGIIGIEEDKVSEVKEIK